MIIYKIKDSKIVGISRKDENYQIKENEYQTNTWYQKPFFNGTEVIESITQAEIDEQFSQAKLNKIAELKSNADSKFKETSWYYERENRLAKGNRPHKNVPQNIIDKDMAIYDLVDLKEIEINALTTIEEVLNYNTNL